MFERKLYHHIDWALVIAILALCSLGLVMIYSTTSDPTSSRAASRMHITQMYAIALGLFAMVFTLTLDYRTLVDDTDVGVYHDATSGREIRGFNARETLLRTARELIEIVEGIDGWAG